MAAQGMGFAKAVYKGPIADLKKKEGMEGEEGRNTL